jgi:nicotinate-nucleotide adenylyltransferase
VALSSEKLGLLGGSFNPVHLAHLVLAQEAWHRFELKRVIFIPVAQNPLKDDPREHTTDDHRLQMLKLALMDDARFGIDGQELRQGGVSYAVDTLRRYREQHKAAELYLLLGADALLSLPRWREIEAYGELCTVVFCNRPGEDDLAAGLPEQITELGLRYEFMPIPALDISSSAIRRRVRMGKPVRYLVPDNVAQYIHTHGVYT